MRSFPWDSIVQAMGDDGLPIYDRAYSAEDFRNVMQVFFSNGVFVNVTDALQVTAGENMTVTVAPGKALINGTTAWEREARTLEIVEAESNDRIDTVVLRWDSNLEQRKIDLYVRQGVSSANPVRPNLTRTESVYELGLADIFVPKNTTSISGERITDTRLESARCGVASPFMKIDTTTFYSQLESALNGMVGELQQQTQTAIDLAQSALDETTAGHLQNQIDKTMIRRDGSIGLYGEQDKIEYWAAKGSCFVSARIMWGDYELHGLLCNWVIQGQNEEETQVYQMLYLEDRNVPMRRHGVIAQGDPVSGWTYDWQIVDTTFTGGMAFYSDKTASEWDSVGSGAFFFSFPIKAGDVFEGYETPASGMLYSNVIDSGASEGLEILQFIVADTYSNTDWPTMFTRKFGRSDSTLPEWQAVLPPAGSITEDMLSSGLKNSLPTKRYWGGMQEKSYIISLGVDDVGNEYRLDIEYGGLLKYQRKQKGASSFSDVWTMQASN